MIGPLRDGASPATEAAAELVVVVVAADPLANPEFLERVGLVVKAGVGVREFGK